MGMKGAGGADDGLLLVYGLLLLATCSKLIQLVVGCAGGVLL